MRRRGLAARGRDVRDPLALPGKGADHQRGGVGVTGPARGVAPAAVLVLYGLQPAHRVVHGVPVPAHLDERLDGGRGGIGVQHGLLGARLGDVGPVRGVGAVAALLGDQPVHRLRGGRDALDPLSEEGQRLPPDTVVRGVLRPVQPGRQCGGRRGRRGRRCDRDRGSGRTEHGGGGGERCCAAAYGHGGRGLSCGGTGHRHAHAPGSGSVYLDGADHRGSGGASRSRPRTGHSDSPSPTTVHGCVVSAGFAPASPERA